MTMALALYYALLLLWLPLLWPAMRTSGGKRVWLLLVTAAGLLATLHEFRMVFWTISAIRVDIFMITPALGGLYVSAALVLFWAARRKAAGALVLVLALIGAGMGYEWVTIGNEAAGLTAKFRTRNALLFHAKFRDRETYDAVFGPFAAGQPALPLGHWRAEGRARYTRLIVNGAGRAWLFYGCGQTECAVGPGGTALAPTGAARDKHWQATLNPRAGLPWNVRIAMAGPGRLSVEAKGTTVTMVKAPPPIAAAPGKNRLTYLGRFARQTCIRAHADVHQLWLWRDGPKLYAIGAFKTLLHGRHAQFVSPMVLGVQTKTDTGWHFKWTRDFRTYGATVGIDGDKVTLELRRPDRPPSLGVLAAKPVFADPFIELAPLTGAKDWTRWFGVVLVGHFTSGDVPACRGP